MTNTAANNPLTLLSQAILFVDSYEQARLLIERNADVREFIIIADNNSKAPAPISAVFKARNAKVFRIRPSGTWNQLIKAMGEVEAAREQGQYGASKDLMFISLLSSHDIACALRRHRATTAISCREMYWLESLTLGVEHDDAIELALRLMPSAPAPIAYQNLTIQQRFDLTAFEFGRFTRPIHCVKSVANMLDGTPFYTSRNFGATFDSALREQLNHASEVVTKAAVV